MLAETFDAEQVAVVTGDAKIGSAFSSLPFDHLFFTGSMPVGRAIMRAASENLVPVTLELGGKSPVIVDRGYTLRTAARRVAYRQVRQWRSDLHLPRLSPAAQGRRRRTSLRRSGEEVDALYPDIAGNPDYTSIVNDRHFARLSGLVEDAKAKGARVVEIGTKQPGDAQSRHVPADAAARRHRRDGGDAGRDLRSNLAGRHL